jgi:flagellar protein FlgJ
MSGVRLGLDAPNPFPGEGRGPGSTRSVDSRAVARSPDGPGPRPSPGNNQELKAAAEQFEAVFLRQMIGSMRSAKLAEDELLGGGNAAETFRDLQDGKLADAMAGQFGIAELLEKQFGSLKK